MNIGSRDEHIDGYIHQKQNNKQWIKNLGSRISPVMI